MRRNGTRHFKLRATQQMGRSCVFQVKTRRIGGIAIGKTFADKQLERHLPVEEWLARAEENAHSPAANFSLDHYARQRRPVRRISSRLGLRIHRDVGIQV